jgi:hypothetical protein
MPHPIGVQVVQGSGEVQRKGAPVAVPLQLPELVVRKRGAQIATCTTDSAVWHSPPAVYISRGDGTIQLALRHADWTR